jgi:hypothetical protein
MRIFIALVLGLILAASPLYAQEAGIAEITDTPRVATRTSVVPIPAARHATQFVVKCELFGTTADGESRPVAAPSLLVLEGQEGTIAVEGERPFVTGVRKTADTEEPLVTKLREGHRCKVTVVTMDEHRVHVDASVSISQISRIETLAETQSPTVSTRSWRTAQCTEFGQPVEVHDWSEGSPRLVARIVINRPGIEDAAITPISAADGDATDDSEVYTVVYAVDDLLEQYAQDLSVDQLKPSDFVLLTEMLRKQAGIEWPKGSSMQPFTANRSLVVSQTRAGHQKISELIEEKRTNVADARKLLTR